MKRQEIQSWVFQLALANQLMEFMIGLIVSSQERFSGLFVNTQAKLQIDVVLESYNLLPQVFFPNSQMNLLLLVGQKLLNFGLKFLNVGFEVFKLLGFYCGYFDLFAFVYSTIEVHCEHKRQQFLEFLLDCLLSFCLIGQILFNEFIFYFKFNHLFLFLFPPLFL